MSRHEERLRRLAIHDGTSIDRLVSAGPIETAGSSLDGRARSLVRLGALVGLHGPETAFDAEVASALANGVTPDEIVDVLGATGTLVGSAHVASAAPRMARALGYDVDADLERPGGGWNLGGG